MKKEPQLFCFEDMEFEKVGDKTSIKPINGTNITVMNCVFEKGCVIPNHHHESEQITIIIKGCLKGKINGKEYIVRSGQGIVIPPHLPHEWVALEDTIDLEIFSPLREKPNFK